VRGGTLTAALVGAVFLLSGCQYLFGYPGLVPPLDGSGSFDPGAIQTAEPGFDSFDPGAFPSLLPEPEDSLPPPLATFTNGTATITIAGKVTKLDHLASPATLYAEFGASAGWTDGKGLYLEFASDGVAGVSSDAFLELDRISDGKHLATSDTDACTVTVKQSDIRGLSGTATCKGLRWADTMANGGFEPPLVADEPAFDATISFQAAP
jgi:hypothetical protein